MTFVVYGRGVDANAELVRQYKISDLDTKNNPTEENPSYYGYVNKDCQWYITKLTNTSARYTRGDADYETNWANRASLTYYNFQYVF